ncbi:PIWI [Entamoeba marina]
MNPASTFDRKGKGQISFAEYYKERYNREVRDMDQPLLVQKKIEKDSEGKEVEKPPAYYIPELMLPTGMTDNMRADRRLMTDLAGMFHADARTKMNELQKTVTDHISNLEDLKEWNIKVDSNPAEFDANRVKNPELRFADGKTLQPQRNRDWNRDLRGYSFLNMKELNDWTAIVPHSCRDDFDKFERELSKYYNRIRVGYKPPRIENWGNSINEIQDSIKNSTLVFAVAATDSIYEQVKKFSVDHHVPTQCIKTQTLRRPTLTPIISMITLQMQGKIGGIPWCIDLDKNFDDAMTVGIDVISSGKEREILAVVNSVDKEMTVYKKSSVVEKKGLHLAGIHIGEYIEDSLESYKDKNGSYPKKVIIYRGSANSGDLKNLKSGELEQIKQKLNDIDSSIQFIYIAVNNKHDMKFFIKEGSNYEGPNPGTVIFNGLTKSDLFQFYLVSHVPKKGLVRPSLYFVLDNTLDVKQDAIYNLTYQLSHLYFNGTNSVCFPSPLYQANKFCKMLNDCGIVEGARRKPQMSGGFGGPRGNRGNMRGRGGDRRGDDRRDDRRDYRRDDRRDDRRDYHRDDRRDDYRRDERRDYRRDDRRDDYRRDERRDDYRRDDYRRDERRDDYRRDERRDDYRRDERRDYRRDDRRDDYRRDERRDYH